MDTSELVAALIKYVGAPAVVAAALAWLFKTLLLEGLRRESDRLRSSIERDSAVALERVRLESQAQLESVRHELNRNLEEYKIRFARLHEKRLDPLVGLFSKVAGLCSKVTVARAVLDVEDEPEWTARIEALRNDCILALRDFHEARVYLPKATADRIQTLIVSVRRGVVRHNAIAQDRPSHEARDVFKDKLNQDYNSLAEELAGEFRSLLGVEYIAPIHE